jgi:two-component system, chemotaxis family, protein-glutamate methylesterase/glutaminase
MSTSVLIVDDSSTVRFLLIRLLQRDKHIRVCATAANGEAALSMLRTVRPDIVLLDLNMPGLDGMEVTKKIMLSAPVHIIIVTSDERSTANPFRLLEAGAVAVLRKPGSLGTPEDQHSAEQLIAAIRSLAPEDPAPAQGELPLPANLQSADVTARFSKSSPRSTAVSSKTIRCIAIGASTGGPVVLAKIIHSLPANYPIPILIVQHIAQGFIGSFVSWMNQNSTLRAVVASQGEAIAAGCVYFAPDDKHLGVAKSGHITLASSEMEHRSRPSVSFLFRSVSKAFGADALGILLTGMGKDGAEELGTMRAAGALTIAQDRESSLIHGMPGEAISRGGASEILPPHKIVQRLYQVAGLGAPLVPS